MVNVNRLLQNSVRCELMGKNMFTFSPSDCPRFWDFDSTDRLCAANVWHEPSLGMSGTLGLGHETNAKDACILQIYRGGEALQLRSVRNFWSPAFMETYYRCKPCGAYKHSGLIVVKERKCITSSDVFVSEITVFNDGREEEKLEFSIESCFSSLDEKSFSVDAKTTPRALKKIFDLKGVLYVDSPLGKRFEMVIPSKGKVTFRYSAAYAPGDVAKVVEKCKKIAKISDIFEQNEKDFNSWFEKNVPELQCENEKILKAYYYRSYLIYKNTFTPKELIPEHFIKGKAIYESATGGWYGCPVGLPVAMQIEDAKWLSDKKYASDHLDNWLVGEGYYQGYIQFTPLAAWHYYEINKDIRWLKKGYRGFVDFTFQKLDRHNSEKLPVTQGSWLTGAEYQPSFYQHTEIPWDYRYDQRRKSEVGGYCWELYRLDELFFTAGNLLACEKMAKALSKPRDEKLFQRRRNEIIDLIKNKFFDEERGVFFDVDLKSGKRCDAAACYDSFAPLMWGLITEEKYTASLEKLLDFDMLGSEFSITTFEKLSPFFWADNAITGPAFASEDAPDFYGCCWNGPVWPFANTIAVEAFGSVAKRKVKYRKRWLELFDNYTSLHFYLGDFSVPDIVEHYRHSDGTPFSATHDYFHSCYIDLLMKYWAGISVTEGRVKFKPFTKEEFKLLGVMINGKKYDFCQRKIKDKLMTFVKCLR